MTADARVVALDVLVVGGGVQGLVLLHELRGAGFSVALVTDADLGAGQTLHAHGILNTGYPFPRRDLRASLERDWVPFAARTGLELYGSDAFFMVPPAATRGQLVEAWTGLGYEHTDVEPGDVPIGLRDGLLGSEAAARGLVRIRETRTRSDSSWRVFQAGRSTASCPAPSRRFTVPAASLRRTPLEPPSSA